MMIINDLLPARLARYPEATAICFLRDLRCSLVATLQPCLFRLRGSTISQNHCVLTLHRDIARACHG